MSSDANLITSNRLSHKRGVITTTTSNVKDINKMIRWFDRVTEHNLSKIIGGIFNG